MTDTEGQMASMLLQNLCTGDKAGRGWEDRRWYLESKMIKSKLSVMGPCYGIVWLWVWLCWQRGARYKKKQPEIRNNGINATPAPVPVGLSHTLNMVL